MAAELTAISRGGSTGSAPLVETGVGRRKRFIARKRRRWRPPPPTSEKQAAREVSAAIRAPAALARLENRVAASSCPRKAAPPFGLHPARSLQFSQLAKAPQMPALPTSQAARVAQGLARDHQPSSIPPIACECPPPPLDLDSLSQRIDPPSARIDAKHHSRGKPHPPSDSVAQGWSAANWCWPLACNPSGAAEPEPTRAAHRTPQATTNPRCAAASRAETNDASVPAIQVARTPPPSASTSKEYRSFLPATTAVRRSQRCAARCANRYSLRSRTRTRCRIRRPESVASALASGLPPGRPADPPHSAERRSSPGRGNSRSKECPGTHPSRRRPVHPRRATIELQSFSPRPAPALRPSLRAFSCVSSPTPARAR